MVFHIRTAKESDLKEILDLQRECYYTEAVLYNEYNLPPLTQTFESIHEEIKHGTLFLKGIVDQQLIASVRGCIKDDTAYIGRLIVKREFQNNNFGQALMKEIEIQLDSCSRYELFTGFKSIKNLKLYQKLGYNEFKRDAVSDNLTLVYLEKFK